jgi:hypothetical protein
VASTETRRRGEKDCHSGNRKAIIRNPAYESEDGKAGEKPEEEKRGKTILMLSSRTVIRVKRSRDCFGTLFGLAMTDAADWMI